MKRTWTIAALLAMGILIPATSPAGVSVAVSIGHQPFSHSRDNAFSSGYNRGYNEGENQGMRDAQRHRSFDLWRHRDYRRAVNDSRDRHGSRVAYAAGFREGFESGYRRAYFAHSRHQPRFGNRFDDRRGDNRFDEPRERGRW